MERKCYCCKQTMPLQEFSNCKGKPFNKDYICKKCKSEKSNEYRKSNKEKRNEYNRKYYKENIAYFREAGRKFSRKNPKKIILQKAKERAKDQNVKFNISENDFEIPEYCPILGVKLFRNGKSNNPNRPTLDKIIPELGYIKGNVAIISARANLIKNNGTAEEHRKIADYIDSYAECDTKRA